SVLNNVRVSSRRPEVCLDYPITCNDDVLVRGLPIKHHVVGPVLAAYCYLNSFASTEDITSSLKVFLWRVVVESCEFFPVLVEMAFESCIARESCRVGPFDTFSSCAFRELNFLGATQVTSQTAKIDAASSVGGQFPKRTPQPS